MKRALLCLLLAGCAAPQWFKADASAQDFERDKWTCVAQAESATASPVATMNLTAARDRIFHACMYARGWQLVE